MAADSGQSVMTGRQSLVFRSFRERSEGIAALYRDGILAFRQRGAVDSFYSAGHAIRLFMHDMPTIFDLPTVGTKNSVGLCYQPLSAANVTLLNGSLWAKDPTG